MSDNPFEAQYDLTKKSRLRDFYDSNKILIYSSIAILVIIFASYNYYLSSKKQKKLLLSENYIQAKVYLQEGNTIRATEVLKEIIFLNDSTYSSLSFFMILSENLISDKVEISKLFDHLLEKNKYDKEVKNLLLYKKALYKSGYVDELKLLEETKDLINNNDSIWKPHTLLLLGDFYFSRKEYNKAKDFYIKLLTINNVQKELHDQAKFKLALITDG